jgi:phosphatidylinositol alpha-1,6-mannosyltransferase
MNIVLLTMDYRPHPGGIATYALETSRALTRQSHNVLVIAPRQKSDAFFDVQQVFHTRRVCSLPFFLELHMFAILISQTIRGNVDHVLNITWYPGALLSWVARLFGGAPYSIVTHASEIMDDTATIKRRLKKCLAPLKIMALKKAHRIFAVSRFTREQILKMGAADGQVVVVPNGVDAERFRPGPPLEELAQKLGVFQKKVLLTVGRLDKHKGHATVLRAMAALKAAFPDMVYLIVGQGPEERPLRGLTAEEGLRNRVYFLGSVSDEDLPRVYSLCSIFVMPTCVFSGKNDLIEGFGIAYIEAAACGKPVIGGRTGGVVDAVEEGVSGLLVEPGSVEDFQRQLEKLLRDPALCLRLGSQARSRVEAGFTWEITVRRLAEHLAAPQYSL